MQHILAESFVLQQSTRRERCNLDSASAMSGVAQRVANAGKQIASNPHVKAVLEQATGAANNASSLVSERYTDMMRKNSKFVIGNSPSFYVTRENVRMHALYTTLAEYALIWLENTLASNMNRNDPVRDDYLKPEPVLCSIPRVSKNCVKEAAQWRQAITKVVQNPKEAVAGDVGYAMLFTAELIALFKVGEFLGRGCTLFGYWP